MQKARLARGFLRHRGLIAFSAGGAMAEATVLSFLAPSARPLAPQVTALPPLAAYHDLRWVFAFNQSWLGFTGVLVLLLLTRSVIDAVLVVLAWPRAEGNQETGLPRPRFVASAVSCAVLTVLVWLVMSPVVTLMFGVALVPFSWPYLAAVPIMLGTALALSQGGVGQAWWRRLPPVRTVGWLLATFAVLSAASVLMTRLDTVAAVAVAGLAGIINARAWYGLTAAAIRRSVERPPHPWYWRAALWRLRRALAQRTSWVPVAPLAAVMVIALVVGLARLTFTGTVRFNIGTSSVVASASRSSSVAAPAGPSEVKAAGATEAGGTVTEVSGVSGTQSSARGAVLVVGGFGSNCCTDANTLRAAEPGMLVSQFSYLGLDRAGQPIPYHRAGNLSIQALGDRMAVQVEKLYQRAHAPVDVVAESEGSLGLYAMLARHPHVHVGSVVLLSPIVDPDQVGQAGDTVPGEALLTLNDLIGGMSPYGGAGAAALIDSVSEVGASYFDLVGHDRGLPWLAVVPLADATTLPACSWPRNVVFVGGFHGGLLGEVSVQRMVERFLANGSPGPDSSSQHGLRRAAEVISAAATAWRMPELHSACP
jgi:hypothetical protein